MDFFDVKSFLDEDRFILTSNSILSKRLVHLYRQKKIEENAKVYLSPKVSSLNYFAEKIFYDSFSQNRVLTAEKSVIILYKILKGKSYQNFSKEHISDLIRHYEILDKNKIKIDFSQSYSNVFTERDEIFKEFINKKSEENLLSYSEILEELKCLLKNNEIDLPSNIVVFDDGNFSLIEYDFIDFLSKKVSLKKINLKCEEVKAKVDLYETPEEEVQGVLNQVLLDWESGFKDIAIGYFEEEYKNILEKFVLEFEKREDSALFLFSLGKSITKSYIFEIIRIILNLYEGVPYQSLLSLVQTPFFEVSGKKEKIKKFQDLLSLDKDPFQIFFEVFGLETELSIFVKNRVAKVKDFIHNLNEILKKLKIEKTTKYYEKIKSYFEFFDFEMGQEEVEVREFAFLFEKVVSHLTIKDENVQNCGIEIVPFRNLPFMNFQKVYLVGCHQGVLPQKMVTFPFLKGEENKKIECFDIEKAYKKEEDFLKCVIGTNREVFLSRSKKREVNGEPFLFSPIIKAEEVEKNFNRYDFKINTNFFSPVFIRTLKGLSCERVKRKKCFNDFEVPFLGRMGVTSELTSIFSCPFQFAMKYLVNVREEEKVTLLFDRKNLGSFLHSLIKEWEEETKNWNNEFQIDEEKLKGITKQFIDKLEISNLEKDTILNLIFRRDNGILKHFVEFERKRIKEGFKIVSIEEGVEGTIFETLVSGKIDRVERKGNEYKIIDFKTSKITLKRDIFQIECYKELLKNEKSNINCQIVKIFNDFEAKEPLQIGLARLLENLTMLRQKSVEIKPYPNDKKGNESCLYCDYILFCHIDEIKEG